MEISLDKEDQIALLTLRGEMGREAVSILTQFISMLEGNDVVFYILDLREVRYIATSAMGFLVRAQDRLKELGGNISFVGVPEIPNPVVDLSHLVRNFEVFPTVEEAMRYKRAQLPLPVPSSPEPGPSGSTGP